MGEAKRGQSTILDRLYPAFNSRIELPVEVFFEPSDLLANIRRTSHVKTLIGETASRLASQSRHPKPSVALPAV